MMHQTNKLKLNNKIGELNQTIAFYFWTMIDSFLINFIPSTIGCNKPNQPILYGPLLLWKPAITNRSIKAKSPTVPSINNINYSICSFLWLSGINQFRELNQNWMKFNAEWIMTAFNWLASKALKDKWNRINFGN